jgi:hypothetical protein
MRPAPALAVTRSGAGELLYQLDVMAADLPDVPLTLAIYADADRLETCLVEVTVVPAGKSWPNLGGREIILHMDNEMYKKTTDSWGVVTFPGIPLDKLKDLLFVVGVNSQFVVQ